jgi:hypothetical protein
MRVAKELPRGKVKISVLKGGLNIQDAATGKDHIVATAGIEALIDLKNKKYKSKN